MGLGHSPSIPLNGIKIFYDAGNAKSYSGTGSTFNDISRNGITGTINNSPQFNYGHGGSFVFNGTNNTISFTRTRFTSGLVYSAWIKTTSAKNTATWTVTTANPIVGDTNNAVWNGFGVHNGKLRYVYYNRAGSVPQTFDSVTSVNTGIWTHVAVVHRSSDDQIFLYINGILDFSASGASSGATDPWANYIAADRVGCGYGSVDFFNGSVAQVCVFSTALTANEIAQLYSATRARYDNFYPIPLDTTNLVLNLDAGNPSSYSGSGTTWTSLTGTNNATLQNGPTFDTANGGTIAFDGSNDYASCASSSDFAFGTGDFTLEMWIKHGTSGSAYQHLFALPDQNTFGLKAYDNGTFGQIYFYSSAYNTDGTIPNTTTSSWVLDRNTWNHIVFLRQSSIGYGYKNGLLKGSKTSFNNNFTAQTLNIGWGWGSEYRSKNIAVARIWKRALSQAEITSSFNALRGRFGL